jgi:hypothetical protein
MTAKLIAIMCCWAAQGALPFVDLVYTKLNTEK